MTRYQRNATASCVYTYHERKKDQKASGYGSLNERLSKDSIKNFDCCCLTLQPCRNPVITPDGYVYDKEAILEYLLHQKCEMARQLKEYERQKKKEEKELEELSKAAKESETKKFIAQESTPARATLTEDTQSTSGTSTDASDSISNMAGDKKTHLPSFWVPALAVCAKESKIDKPDLKICCPMSGKPLKMRDLIPIHFTLADGEKAGSSTFKKDRYVCAVTKDILTNASSLAVLKKSGAVVTTDAIENIIKKDWIDPISNVPITESDIIYVQRGGTGYSSTNEKLQAKIARPVMELQ